MNRVDHVHGRPANIAVGDRVLSVQEEALVRLAVKRFLKLRIQEAEDGFDNTAALGGLANVLESMLANAPGETTGRRMVDRAREVVKNWGKP